LWDDAILHLCQQLLELDMDPSTIEDLSTGLDIWRHQALLPQPQQQTGHMLFSHGTTLFMGLFHPHGRVSKLDIMTARATHPQPATWTG